MRSTHAVSLFCQYLCSVVPVRGQTTVSCYVARDDTQVYDTTCEAAAKGSPYGDETFLISNIKL